MAQMLAGMKDMHRCATEYEVLKDGQKIGNVFAQLEQLRGMASEETYQWVGALKTLLFGDGTYKDTFLNSVRVGGISKEQINVLLNIHTIKN